MFSVYCASARRAGCCSERGKARGLRVTKHLLFVTQPQVPAGARLRRGAHQPGGVAVVPRRGGERPVRHRRHLLADRDGVARHHATPRRVAAEAGMRHAGENVLKKGLEVPVRRRASFAAAARRPSAGWLTSSPDPSAPRSAALLRRRARGDRPADGPRDRGARGGLPVFQAPAPKHDAHAGGRPRAIRGDLLQPVQGECAERHLCVNRSQLLPGRNMTHTMIPRVTTSRATVAAVTRTASTGSPAASTT